MLSLDALHYEGIQVDAELFRKKLSLLPFDDEDDVPAEGESEGYILRHDLLGVSEIIRGKVESLMVARIQRTVDDWIRLWNQRHGLVLEHLQKDQLNEQLDQLLTSSLDAKHALDFEAMKSTESFESTETWTLLKLEMEGIKPPPPPKMPITPPQPVYTDPELGLGDTLMFRRRRLIQEANEAFEEKLAAWQKVCERIKSVIADKTADYALDLQMYERRKADMAERIIVQRRNFEEQQRQQNDTIDVFSVNYRGAQTEAVERYVNAVLDASPWPKIFPGKRFLEYNQDNRTLYLAFELPHPTLLPRERRVTGADGKSVQRVSYTDKECQRRYNDMVYLSLLRYLHEVFSGDTAGIVEAIQVSAWVHTLNKGNGQFEDNTIASIFCTRAEFSGINLRQVDPTLCFRFLKGVSAPDLTELIPIPTPHRFQVRGDATSGQRTLEPMDSRTNLAGLNMTEFGRNLFDLFEKEFRLMPGEIKLLPEGADGSLEAWGIDPEPIRGGKFIIQARMGHHGVPVSAVKELYGSMVHEGATRGILVTTADFAPEAYEFARNKPIILLNGNQVLALFDKHGVPARISFREVVSLRSWIS